MTGADSLARTLVEQGVDCVFGLPGTQNVPTFEAFRRARLRTVQCVHELGASFMANGYARASGRVGVVVTIPGPGFTYALPGLAEARLDSAPLLHIVGQPPSGPGGRFLHQAIPQEAMVRDLVKAVIPVEEADHMRDAAIRGLEEAVDGDPGPVVLHVASKAQTASCSAGFEEGGRADVASGASSWEDALEALRDRLGSARRPVVYAGLGAASGASSVLALVERLGAPFFTTPSGRGVIDERHPLALRFDPDRSSVGVLNQMLDDADLIVALGCRMGFNGTAAFGIRLPEEKLVHVNTDPAALDGMRPAGLGVRGPVEDVLPRVLEMPGDWPGSTWREEEVEGWRRRLRRPEGSGPREPQMAGVASGEPAELFRALRSALPDDGIVVTDSGLHQVMTRRHLTVTAPRGLIIPADFQSMGFGVPAAMGASLGAPDRPVVAVVGDGGFAMAAMELLTAAREGFRVVIVVINDGYLNLIRLQQIQDDGVTHAVDLKNPGFRVLAEALDVGYALVDGDPEDTFTWALEQPGPVLVEVLAGDSSDIVRARVAGAARRVARKVAGPSVRGFVKRLLGRR